MFVSIAHAYIFSFQYSYYHQKQIVTAVDVTAIHRPLVDTSHIPFFKVNLPESLMERMECQSEENETIVFSKNLHGNSSAAAPRGFRQFYQQTANEYAVKQTAIQI